MVLAFDQDRKAIRAHALHGDRHEAPAAARAPPHHTLERERERAFGTERDRDQRQSNPSVTPGCSAKTRVISQRHNQAPYAATHAADLYIDSPRTLHHALTLHHAPTPHPDLLSAPTTLHCAPTLHRTPTLSTPHLLSAPHLLATAHLLSAPHLLSTAHLPSTRTFSPPRPILSIPDLLSTAHYSPPLLSTGTYSRRAPTLRHAPTLHHAPTLRRAPTLHLARTLRPAPALRLPAASTAEPRVAAGPTTRASRDSPRCRWALRAARQTAGTPLPQQRPAQLLLPWRCRGAAVVSPAGARRRDRHRSPGEPLLEALARSRGLDRSPSLRLHRTPGGGPHRARAVGGRVTQAIPTTPTLGAKHLAKRGPPWISSKQCIVPVQAIPQACFAARVRAPECA